MVKKGKWSLLVTAFILLFGVFSTVLFYEVPLFSKNGNLWNSVAVVVSLLFSVVALIVALMTFSSIDSVNQITSMEGNVFENEAYAVAYSELIEEYCECKDGAAFEDAFVKKLLNQVRNQSNTCKSFADAIQNIIDQIVWAEYIHFGHLKEKTNKDIDQLVNRIRKKQKKFNKLSNGTMYLLEENIKLIELIFSYQAKKSKNDDIQENRNALLNIRGAMIRNPISQIN